MATNGSRKTAANSQALNAGAQTPIRGDKASPTPADVPFRPLTSAYVRTALMKDTPTSGPIPKSNTHHARDTISSRHSLSRSQKNADLGERKKYLFQVLGYLRQRVRFRLGCELRHSALATHASTTEQHKPVAETRCVADLMNRQKKRPPAGNACSERGRNVACLAQVETVKGLVDEQRRLGSQQADS